MRAVRRLLALGALVGAASVWSRFDTELRASRARLHGSTIADTPRGPIEHAEEGDGSPLLIVHGAGGGFDQGLALGRPLVRRGFRVIAPSRFGYLRTPLPADASPEAQADAHAALLDALAIDRAAVLGASAGAPSASQFALRHPSRCAALVLMAPLAWSPDAANTDRTSTPLRERVLEAMVSSDFAYWLAKTLAPDQVIARILGTPPALVHAASASERDRVRAMMNDILPISERGAGLVNEGRIARGLTDWPLERIAAPTLIVGAEDDGYGTWPGARHAARRIPGARLLGFATGGHLLIGRQDEVTEAIAAFLRAALSPSGV